MSPSIVLAKIHSSYLDFAAPESRLSYSGGLLTIEDSAIYNTSYVSVNGSAWVEVPVNGTYLFGSSTWLETNATINLSTFNFGNGTNSYIAVYSCADLNVTWDCYENQNNDSASWQIYTLHPYVATRSTDIPYTTESVVGIDRSIKYTSIPKATANWSAFNDTYTIDLDRFGIYNDGTHAVETSAGLNAALEYVKTLNINRLIFPNGTYLISENESVNFSHQDLIVDFNGATLQMNTNYLDDYIMVNVNLGTKNFRMTNGTFLGDRATHDYDTIVSTHEHSGAINFNAGYEVEFDHMEVREFPGFTINTVSGLGALVYDGQYTLLYTDDFESGAYNDSGNKTADATKIRSITPYTLDKFLEEYEFEFGESYGYQGLFWVKERNYEAYFYNASMDFIEKKNLTQFQKTNFSEDAYFVNFVFDQANFTAPYDNGTIGRLSDYEGIEHLHFHDNHIYRNRGLGLAVVGGQKMIIENNLFEENGYQDDNANTTGALPAMAVDYEDGWDLMQDIIFRNNDFVNNRADLVIIAGTELIVENNSFEYGVHFWSRAGNYVYRYNNLSACLDRGDGITCGRAVFETKVGEKYRAGTAIYNNYYSNLNQFFIQAGTFRNPPITLRNEIVINSSTTSGYNFTFYNSTFNQTRFLVGNDTYNFTFYNSTFYDAVTIFTYDDGPNFTVTNINSTGTLDISGDYANRSINITS